MQGLKKEFFNGKEQAQLSTDALLLDAMSIGEEISNIRKGNASQ